VSEPRWRLLYHRQVSQEDIPRLDPPTRRRIRRAIESKLTASPENFGKPLAYNRSGIWSLRVDDWRVLFALRGHEVWILRIGHRSEVYQALEPRVP
jgi:mRNA interferase RelE/StbE